jgi:hypothetical protein
VSTRGHHGLLLAGAAAPSGLSVVSVTSTLVDTAATSHPISMPASVTAGQRLLVILAVSKDLTAAPAVNITTPSGWTLVTTSMSIGSSSRAICGIFEKTAAGTEGGTTVDFVTDVASTGAAQCILINGAVNTSAAGFSALGSTSTPNPPSVASGKTGSIIWFSGAARVSAAAPTAYSSGFPDFQTATGSSGTFPCSVAQSSVVNTSGTVDPGVLTYAANINCRGFTIAVN